MLSSVHYEERDFAIAEVKIVLIFMRRVVISVGIVTAERVVGILERSNSIVGLTNEIVDYLDVI